MRPDGRANPKQLTMTAESQTDIAELRQIVIDAHKEATGDDDDLMIGLQLTHSGRFCKPNDNTKFESIIAYHHPLLDKKFGYPAGPAGDQRRRDQAPDRRFRRSRRSAPSIAVTTSSTSSIVTAISRHEFLSAVDRPGPYGGSLENRTRFLREIVEGIRAEAPRLRIGVRLSAVDSVPFKPDPARSLPGALGPGVPEDHQLPYRYAFGADRDDPLRYDLTETKALLEILRGLGIRFVNVTAGSPYYNPHYIRPALYPPSDGYHPPEDPFVGVMRQLSTWCAN